MADSGMVDGGGMGDGMGDINGDIKGGRIVGLDGVPGRRPGLGGAAVVAMAVVSALSTVVAAANDGFSSSGSQSRGCGSTVSTRCHAPLSMQPVVIDPAFPVGGITRRQWRNILNSVPDAGKIVIFGERMRGPEVHAVFSRNLGTNQPEQITHKAPGGALCTTSTRSGSTYCSQSGNVMPGIEPPIVQTWTFHF